MSIHKRKNKKSEQPEQEVMIAKIVDMSLEDFEKELIAQKVNVGIINNLILNLEGVYYELRVRKDAVLELVFKGIKSKEDPEIKKAIDGLYAEMIKVEQKITYLKQRSKELVDVG